MSETRTTALRRTLLLTVEDITIREAVGLVVSLVVPTPPVQTLQMQVRRKKRAKLEGPRIFPVSLIGIIIVVMVGRTANGMQALTMETEKRVTRNPAVLNR